MLSLVQATGLPQETAFRPATMAANSSTMMRFLYLWMMAGLSLGMDISVRSSLNFDVAAAKNRPVSKVITLLKDMLKQLEKEAEEDEEIYDKMACWCETNDKEKTKSITDARPTIKRRQNRSQTQ